MYTIIETAKMNGLDPEAYLADVIARIADHPVGFGRFGKDLLVGNFGDGRINAFDPDTGAFRGQLQGQGGRSNPITIDGLWGLGFGNGGLAGPTDTLFFTSGPNGEMHGLFGSITKGER
jgi:uncharacterized protein (TIGR03118 family)